MQGIFRFAMMMAMLLTLSSCFMSDNPLFDVEKVAQTFPIAATRFFASSGDGKSRFFVRKTADGYLLADEMGKPATMGIRFFSFPGTGFFKNRFIMEERSIEDNVTTGGYYYLLVTVGEEGSSVTILSPVNSSALEMCQNLSPAVKARLAIASNFVGCSFTSTVQLKAAYDALDPAPGYGWNTNYSIAPLAEEAQITRRPFTKCDDPSSWISLSALKRHILLETPRRYEGKIRNTEFVYVDDSTHLGPYSDRVDNRPGTYRLSFPRDFLRNQCKISFIQVVTKWASRPSATQVALSDWTTPFEAKLKVCIHSPPQAIPCFSRAFDQVITDNLSLFEVITDEDLSTGETLLVDALRRITLHETGHVVLGHLDRDERAGDELDADTYALFYALTSGAVPGANMNVFYAYSFLEPYFPKGDPHGSFFCRDVTGWFVERALGNTPFDILASTGTLIMDSNADEEPFRAELQSQAPKMSGDIGIGVWRLTCPVVRRASFHIVPKDLANLGKLVASDSALIERTRAGGDPAPIVRKILALSLVSSDGRALAYRVAASLIEQATIHWKGDDWRRAGLGALTTRVINEDRQQDMTIQSYATLLGIGAISNYISAPDEKVETLAPLRDKLKHGLSFGLENETFLAMAGLLEIQLGDCDAGIKDYGRGVELARARDSAKQPEAVRTVEQILAALKEGEQKLGCQGLAQFVPYLAGRKKPPQPTP